MLLESLANVGGMRLGDFGAQHNCRLPDEVKEGILRGFLDELKVD